VLFSALLPEEDWSKGREEAVVSSNACHKDKAANPGSLGCGYEVPCALQAIWLGGRSRIDSLLGSFPYYSWHALLTWHAFGCHGQIITSYAFDAF
jgi:hypothetical protein